MEKKPGVVDEDVLAELEDIKVGGVMDAVENWIGSQEQADVLEQAREDGV